MRTFVAPALLLVAAAASPARGDDKVDKTRLPKPIQTIACDMSVFEQGGVFTIIDIRYEEVGEAVKGDGIVWTLKANREISCADAKRLLKNRTARFYRDIKDARQEVMFTYVFLPNKLEFGGFADQRLQANEAVEIYMFLDADEIRRLTDKKAGRMILSEK